MDQYSPITGGRSYEGYCDNENREVIPAQPVLETPQTIIVCGQNAKVECKMDFSTPDRSCIGFANERVKCKDLNPSNKFQKSTCMTNNLCVKVRSTGTRVVCAKDEVIINGVKFQAHLLTGISGFARPSMDQVNTVATGIKIWDNGAVAPYVEFEHCLCVILKFKSNGKKLTIKRPNSVGNFCPSNKM